MTPFEFEGFSYVVLNWGPDVEDEKFQELLAAYKKAGENLAVYLGLEA